MIEIYYMTWNTSSNEGKCMFLLKTFGLICAAYGILSVLTGCDSTVGFKSQVRTETWEAVVILENEPRVPDADQPSIQPAGQEDSISVPDVALENMAADKSEKTVSRKSAGREVLRHPLRKLFLRRRPRMSRKLIMSWMKSKNLRRSSML